MNDYGGFDLDLFGGNGYQRSASTVVQQQTHQQQFAGRGPTLENYDPARIAANTMSMGGTYNANVIAPRPQPTHRTMMPSTGPLGAPPSTLQHGHQQIRGMADFEPLPLSTGALQRMMHGTTNTSFKQPISSNALVTASQARTMPTTTQSMAMFAAANNSYTSQQQQQRTRQNEPPPKPPVDPWLEELRLEVSGLSLEPMSGVDILHRVETRSEEVITKYLPCVDFLVQCQQELRKGLAAATTKRVVNHMFRDAMTPRQFYNSYIANLPERFYRKNRKTMKPEDLDAAVKELQTLCLNAKGAERQGCEVVKNTFLGGMKDGESWGLRKWLSKHGGALYICNDSECILHSCQKLDRSLDSTRKLGEKLRPIAKRALTRLKADVPSSYQEHSTAHPYLPFFHRLEAALKGMSNFDPEDDDVICIDDDDEVEELKATIPPPQPEEKKRKASTTRPRKKPAPAPAPPPAKKPKSDESDGEDSFIEVLNELKPSTSRKDTDIIPMNENDDAIYMQELLKTFDDDNSHSDLFGGDTPDFDNINLSTGKKDAFELAAGIDRLAVMFDSKKEALVRPRNIPANSFWNESENYASALRLLTEILRSPDSSSHLEPVNELELVQLGQPSYTSIIRHPLCLRDIVTGLIEETDDMSDTVTSNDGRLPTEGLESWNMWNGYDLLSAIDLVLLNALAYGKAADEGRSSERSKTNKLRKILWAGIKNVIDLRIPAHDQEMKKESTPTRRGESSGFVVFKEK